jgi:hypothetical protein
MLPFSFVSKELNEKLRKKILFFDHECGLDVNSLLKDSSHNRFILEFKRDLWGKKFLINLII